MIKILLRILEFLATGFIGQPKKAFINHDFVLHWVYKPMAQNCHIIELYFYLFIAVFCVKMSCVVHVSSDKNIVISNMSL